jgi:nucleoside-diphosphate-sugar epimerase
MSRGPVFVTGATGFVGRAFCAEAAGAGYAIRALRRTTAGRVSRASDPVSISWVEGDLLDPRGWRGAVEGASAFVHLAARVRGSEGELRRVNVEGTRVAAEIAEEARIRRFVHVSSAVVSDGDEDPYARSKAESEAVIRSLRIPWVVLRPTLVVGEGETANLPRYVAKFRRLPLVPVLGRVQVQPLFVGDLARALVAAIDSPAAIGRTYELAGGDVVPHSRFLEDLARVYGAPHARTIRLPLLPFRLAAPVLDAVATGQRARRAVSYHGRDHVYDTGPARRDLGFAPLPWAETVGRLGRSG